MSHFFGMKILLSQPENAGEFLPAVPVLHHDDRGSEIEFEIDHEVEFIQEYVVNVA